MACDVTVRDPLRRGPPARDVGITLGRVRGDRRDHRGCVRGVGPQRARVRAIGPDREARRAGAGDEGAHEREVDHLVGHADHEQRRLAQLGRPGGELVRPRFQQQHAPRADARGDATAALGDRQAQQLHPRVSAVREHDGVEHRGLGQAVAVRRRTMSSARLRSERSSTSSTSQSCTSTILNGSSCRSDRRPYAVS